MRWIALVAIVVALGACHRTSALAGPPGDCAPVAEALASIELGNYAEPDDRAPVVGKHREACEAAHVTKAEGTCLAAATDKWTAARCSPRMFRRPRR